MNYRDENTILLNNSFDRMFFKNWHYTNKDRGNFKSLELDVTYKCDLACKYCYVARYDDILYPKELRNNDRILKNTRALINWLIKNEMNPDLDIFSGELFSQKIGFLILEEIYDIYKDTPDHLRPSLLLIPSNFTFLLSDKLTQKVDQIIENFKSINIRVSLSASVEGKYMEQNRPFKNRKKEVRDDAFYNKVFKYCAENRFGFHPMVYSNNIEKWEDNFLWFQENFKKHGIPPFEIYLLEVRNEEWTDKQILEFQKFYDFLIKWLFDFSKRDKHKFLYNVFNHRGFNIISSPLSTVGRGIGCSIQSTLYVRMGDLKIFPCHRLFYEHFKTAEFQLDVTDNIVGIIADNPELAIQTYSFQSQVAPYCNACAIKYVCSKGCLGAQFETTGDLFTPIPTVCKLEFAKVAQLVMSFKELGVFNLIKNGVQDNVRENLDIIDNYLIKK